MYLLEAGGDGGGFVQGFVRLTWPTVRSAQDANLSAWARLFMRSAAIWHQLGAASVAVRMDCVPGQPIETTHSFVAEAGKAANLRLLLAAFLRTDGIAAARAVVPHREGDLDADFLHADEPRLAVVRESLRTATGLNILHDFRIGDHAAEIFEATRALEIPCAYAFQITPWTVPKDLLRRILLDASLLQGPEDLVEDQRRMRDRLKQAAFHLEECLSAPDDAALESVHGTVADVLGQTLYARFNAEPRVAMLSGDAAQPFANLVHSHVMSGAPAAADLGTAAGAITRVDADRLIACEVLGLAATAAAAGSLAVADPVSMRLSADAGRRAPRSDDKQPFLFVSYARDDRERVIPAVDAILADGVALWIDREIVGGDDWLAELERRLLGCAAVLAFVSARFNDSRYCRREIQFADALGKPIIPVMLQQIQLSGGLDFILRPIQHVDAAKDFRLSDVLAAIGARSPEVRATKLAK